MTPASQTEVAYEAAESKQAALWDRWEASGNAADYEAWVAAADEAAELHRASMAAALETALGLKLHDWGSRSSADSFFGDTDTFDFCTFSRDELEAEQEGEGADVTYSISVTRTVRRMSRAGQAAIAAAAMPELVA